MNDNIKKELIACMDRHNVTNMPTEGLPDLRYDVNPYSPIYEPLIQQAVQYKRAGKYDEAIRCYIKIFDDAECFNTEIVRYLCKVLICDGELLFAFYWLGAAYNVLVAECGPCPNPYVPSVPWAQLQDAINLLNACINLLKTMDLKLFCDYVAPIAGNPNYVPTCETAVLAMQANEVLRAFNSAH